MSVNFKKIMVCSVMLFYGMNDANCSNGMYNNNFNNNFINNNQQQYNNNRNNFNNNFMNNNQQQYNNNRNNFNMNNNMINMNNNMGMKNNMMGNMNMNINNNMNKMNMNINNNMNKMNMQQNQNMMSNMSNMNMNINNNMNKMNMNINNNMNKMNMQQNQNMMSNMMYKNAMMQNQMMSNMMLNNMKMNMMNNNINNMSYNNAQNNINNYMNNANQYLSDHIWDINKSKDGSNGYINCLVSDYNLFIYNITNNPTARKNMLCLLNSLFYDDNGNKLYNLGNYDAPKALINLIYFLNTKHLNSDDHFVYDLEGELITVIAYYYIKNLTNPNSKDKEIEILENETLEDIVFEYVEKNIIETYKKYYYNKRLGNNPSKLDKVSEENWKNAIKKVKEIGLANVIKKLIIGINLGCLLENKQKLSENKQKVTNQMNEILGDKNDNTCKVKVNGKPISCGLPIFLNNNNKQSGFDACVQLVNSAFNCATEIKYNTNNNTNGNLVLFLKFLQSDSSKYLEQYKQNDPIPNNNNETSVHKILEKMRNITSNNNIIELLQPKLNSNNNVFDPITSFSMLNKAFPEITSLFFKNWGDAKGTFNINNTFKITNSDDITHRVPLQKNISYFLMRNLITNDWNSNGTSFQDQVNHNLWKVGFDENRHFVFYRLNGLIINTKNKYYSAFVKLNNNSGKWYFANKQMISNTNGEETTLEKFLNSKNFSHIENNVHTFMYRKMTLEEMSAIVN